MNMHKSVERALDTLDYLSRIEKKASLTEICQHLDAPKTSMNPIIYTLVAKKFLVYNNLNGTYALGPANYRIGNQYIERLDYLKYIRNVMEKVVDKCSETCFFAILQGSNVVYILKVDSPEKIRMFSSIGTIFPAYATALGKAMLSQYDSDYIRSLYPDGFKPITKKTITNFSDFMKQLRDVSQKGYAIDEEESDVNILCRAVPIFKSGQIVAAMSISTPSFRFTKKKQALIIESLMYGKKEIEQVLAANQIDFSTLI